MFCKKCGSLMVPDKDLNEKKSFKSILLRILKKLNFIDYDSDRKFMKCNGCGYVEDVDGNNIDGAVINETIEQSKVKMGVVEKENELAVHNHICSKCGHDKAMLIEKGIWYSDEDFVVHYKCGDCGHVDKGEGKVT